MIQYLNDFYKKGVIEGYFANTVSAAGDIDPNSLPDPASTNLATAQQTANDAYIVGSTALAKTRGWVVGSLDVVDLDTTAEHVFEEEQDDAEYRVILTRSAESAGAAGAAAVDFVDKTQTGFTVTFVTAPGAGNSVTWDFLVCR